MTSAVDETHLDETTAAPGPDGSPPVASWVARAGAFAVDVLLGIGIVATMAVVARSAEQWSWLWWLCVAVGAVTGLLMLVNRWLLPSLTGWSLGRAVAGVVVVTRAGSAAKVWRLLARDVAHVLDTAALLIGWLWPLVDSRRRTFADLLARTEVHRDAPQRDMRRVAAAVMLTSALLCAAVVGLSYLTIFRHDQAVDDARAQIGEQGPKIVTDILSFGADSMPADFARAQSLVTDAYRPQLVTQQQTVQQATLKAGATTNEYWVANHTVLSASADHASMLLAMQGQRTAGTQAPRFISATVRVNFDKSVDGQWRVADLTVLTKPKTPEPVK